MKSYVIWGMGLLGASLGLDLKKRGHSVIGIEKSQQYIDILNNYGFTKIYHVDDPFMDELRNCHGIILGTPVDQVYQILESLASAKLPDSVWITDMASTKSQLMDKVNQCDKKINFIGSHPMAGSDLNGPAHARPDLFSNATIFVTPATPKDGKNLSDSYPQLVNDLKNFWQETGAFPYEIASEVHDKWAAYLSHGLHLVSCMVSCLLDDIPEVYSMEHPPAGGSFRDITRVAGSNPELWEGIINSNSGEIAHYLDSLEKLTRDWKDRLKEKKLPIKEIFTASAKIRSNIMKNKTEK